MYRIPKHDIRIVREGTAVSATERPSASCSREVADIVRQMIGDSPREHLLLLALDSRNRVCSVYTVAIGGIHACAASVGDVLRYPVIAAVSAFVLAAKRTP